MGSPRDDSPLAGKADGKAGWCWRNFLAEVGKQPVKVGEAVVRLPRADGREFEPHKAQAFQNVGSGRHPVAQSLFPDFAPGRLFFVDENLDGNLEDGRVRDLSIRWLRPLRQGLQRKAIRRVGLQSDPPQLEAICPIAKDVHRTGVELEATPLFLARKRNRDAPGTRNCHEIARRNVVIPAAAGTCSEIAWLRRFTTTTKSAHAEPAGMASSNPRKGNTSPKNSRGRRLEVVPDRLRLPDIPAFGGRRSTEFMAAT